MTANTPKTAQESFTCSACGEPFSMPKAVLERFPGWTPQKCRPCHSGKAPGPAGAAPRPPQSTSSQAGSALTPPTASPVASPGPLPLCVDGGPLTPSPALQLKLDEVLQRHHDGPTDGIFTDGGCSGNPGPGGWGAVYVRSDQIVVQRFGRAPQTTNNRMELMALTAGYEMIVADEEVTIWSDSQLCVNTLNIWAARWEANDWKKKGGPIKNLDLIRPLYALYKARPNATVHWVKAHAGRRWNEYVDTLATALL